MNNCKISIITCTYNSEKYLAQSIESVLNQSYKNIEHIFIDGGSTDKTLEIIQKYYPEPILISEPDNGIYDALNKGLKIASGNIIGQLHSDDVLADINALNRVVEAFSRNAKLAYYCSKMEVCDEDLNNCFAVLGAAPHQPTWRDYIYSSNYYAHPTYYCKREVIERVGLYSLEYKLAADIDWLLRLESLKLPSYFDEQVMIKFRSAGSTAKKYFLALYEEFLIRQKNQGLKPGLIVVYAYHFLRRLLRCVLEKIKLVKLINFFRKLIFKLVK